jgi:hypothetical protein
MVLNLIYTRFAAFFEMKEMLPKLLNKLYTHRIDRSLCSSKESTLDRACETYLIFSAGDMRSELWVEVLG